MQKSAGWENRLSLYLGEAARKPFVEGHHDCALFAAGAVLAMTGVDLAADWRGRYNTTRGGLRVLRRAGYADHVALASAHFAERPAILSAVPGDLAAVETTDGQALGVVQGEMIYILRREGLGLVPLTLATRVWEV